MTRKVKVELYEGGLYGKGYFTVEIPIPTKYESSKLVVGQRKVVVRNWGNNKYSVALFNDIDALQTTDVVCGRMSEVASAAAEFLH